MRPEKNQVSMALYNNKVLIYFSLTVKAVTLIFSSGRGSAISSAKQEKSGSIKNKYVVLAANVRAFHANPNRI